MFTLGTDPEVFAYDPVRKQVIPAYFAMGGDVDWELPFGKAYPDGAAVEFTVAPSETGAEIAERILTNLRHIRDRLAETGLQISLRSHADVASYISLLPESYGKRASLQILGCDKDIRVYEESWMKPSAQVDPKRYLYRTIGTHIHVELNADLIQDWPFIQIYTAYLDSVLGAYATILMRDDTPAQNRRNLYGQSGSIRIKTTLKDGYDGVEYRVLPSHAVIGLGVDGTAWFFDTAQVLLRRALTVYEDGISACIEDLGGLDRVRDVCARIDSGFFFPDVLKEQIARFNLTPPPISVPLPTYIWEDRP